MKTINNTIRLFFLIAAFALRAQDNYDLVRGAWQGTISTPNGDLALALNIRPLGSKLNVSLDVPAQRAMGITATEAWFRHDSILVEFEKLRARYTGILDGDKITGDWEQSDHSFPLLLTRGNSKQSAAERIQFSGNQQDVVFKNIPAGISLAGTFTWPKNGSCFPAVILISGSGPQDRNETILGHQPFLALAQHLTEQGIAVLRYDDRGTAQSTGSFSSATSFDFSTDVEAALAYLKTRPEVDKKKIGLAGHSEGGMIAPMLAARSSDIAFIVLLAGPGIKGYDLLLLQADAISRASGIEESLIAKNRSLNKRIYAIAGNAGESATDSITSILKSEGMPADLARRQAETVNSAWFRYFLTFDPAPALKKIKCPVLVLNGRKDLQVPFAENIQAIENTLRKAGHHNYSIKTYEGLNHLFQRCNTGLPAEYATLPGSFDQMVLSDISSWILKLK